MAITNPTPLVYDDPKLACIAQQVVFAVPWVTQPTVKDFPLKSMPRMEVPVLSWVVQDSELNWREKLITYLNSLLGDNFATRINALPGNFITAILSNIFYNSRAYVDCVFPPRLEEEMSNNSYAASAYWVAYHVCGMLLADITVNKIDDAAYRTKQLSDLQRVIAFCLGQVLTDNPVVKRSNKVIVAATNNTAERNTIYVDADNLDRYFNQGHTIDQLCTGWLMSKTNPSV